MQTLEIVGAVIGLIYLYFEYKASRWLWPVGVVMPLVYIVLFYRAKFYADMGINVYYLFASLYGWAMWNKGKTSPSDTTSTSQISHTPVRYIAPLAGIGGAVFALIALVLVNCTDSPVSYADSFTTALSIVGMWMLAHKYIEQWGVWFVVNAVSCGLYCCKGLHYTGALFALYAVISVLGYFKWRKIMRRAQQGGALHTP